MTPYEKITDEIELLEQTIADLEHALSRVIVPKVRSDLLAKIEDIKDSIQVLRDNLEADEAWDQQNIFDR
jgi:hypothetical protein